MADDGCPHAALSSYLHRDTTFWLPTVAGPVRERNLRATPWLTLVIAEGPAEVSAPAEVPADVRAAVAGEWVTAWIRLTAERVLLLRRRSARLWQCSR